MVIISTTKSDTEFPSIHIGGNTRHQQNTETNFKATGYDEIDLESPITKQELQDARQSLQQAKRHAQNLSPLRPIDKTKYTVRVNTWRRHEQLIVMVKHLLTCPGVAQIQVVWCETEDEEDTKGREYITNASGSEMKEKKKKFSRPPQEIVNYTLGESPMVVIEYHSTNSLNERFNIMPTTHTPTYGILSIDDDVLRPCEALDDGFFRWTDHPDRLLGYDYRMHIVSTDTKGTTSTEPIKNYVNDGDDNHSMKTWSYGYLSSSRRYNRYSMVLPRFSFIHIDYLSLYTKYVPRRIQLTVNDYFNCEDIAMSFFVSSLTEAKVPLLANQWSMSTMVKLSSPAAISQTSDHKSLRDKCVNDFANLLGLKDGYRALTRKTDRCGNIEIINCNGTISLYMK